MKPWERWTFNLTTIVVTVTGVGYLWTKYGLRNDDPFAVVNHPWQPFMLNLHLLVSPVFLLIFGIILNSHVVRKLGLSGLPHRKSGHGSLAALGVMVGSGYLLQVAVEPAWSRALVVLHVGSAGAFAALYAAHVLLAGRLSRRRPEPPRVLEVA